MSARIRAAHRECEGAYGSRRMARRLKEDGEHVGRRRVRRLMRENSVFAVQPRRFRKTTDSDHDFGIAPNLLEQDFDVKQLNRVWVSDITYIWTEEGWSFLAVVLDLCSRRVVGWAIDDNMKADLPLKALERALRSRQPTSGLIQHSDRGSQYASHRYRKLLADWEAIASMSGTGNCYDNAVAESFFASLKKERIRHQAFATRTEAHDAVAKYIDGFYNPTRYHSTLGYLSPVRYEQEQRLAQAA
ncbi:MAG: IS3 family transposase [Polyangiaceae bacterium]|nr:IS3 family transposase [Polyangiaceae bacterium]